MKKRVIGVVGLDRLPTYGGGDPMACCAKPAKTKKAAPKKAEKKSSK
jgi:hypothetical protein